MAYDFFSKISLIYENYPINPLQAPLQYQNQIPPQPIYPDNSYPYSQPSLQPQIPPVQQEPYYPNSQSQETFSQPPPLQSEIMVNDIEQPIDRCGTVMQIIFIIYLLGYSIWDIIYQIKEYDQINISIVDDILLIIFAVIIGIFALREKQPNSVILCIYGFISWFIGFPFKIAGLAIRNGGLSTFVVLMLIIRFVFVGIIFIYSCPAKCMDKLGKKRRKIKK